MKELDLVSDHVPVLLSNFSSLLPSTLGIWVDGTFGFGGYSRWLLKSGATKVIAIDIDPDTLSPAFALEKSWPGKFKILAGNFCDMHGLVSSLGFKNVSGIVLDVGISSMHIDCPIRGFSIKNDGPLDMRMSKKGPSAKDFINGATEELIAEVLLKYGEERHAKAIAKRIVENRQKQPINSTHQLIGIIDKVLGNKSKRRIHPATRSFQAIRVAINRELENLIGGLASAYKLLDIGGVLAVITFHSLEDRIVKRFFNLRTENYNSIDEIKCVGGNSEPLFTKLNKRPVTPTPQEIFNNPRARSAKLRMVKKISQNYVNINPGLLGLPKVSPSLKEFQCD